jgi:hypothetical protein
MKQPCKSKNFAGELKGKASEVTEIYSELARDPAALSIIQENERRNHDLRDHIAGNPRLKKDLEFVVRATGMKPGVLRTGLLLQCNLMIRRDRWIRKEHKKYWPIAESTIRGAIRDIRRTARQIDGIEAKYSPFATYPAALKKTAMSMSVGSKSELPKSLRDYATDLERRVNVRATSWNKVKPLMLKMSATARQDSIYERIRAASGKYHANRLHRLINAAREINGLPAIKLRALTVWLNRQKQRTK